MPNKVDLSISKGSSNEFSYIKLYKKFLETEIANHQDFMKALAEIEFIEEQDIEYNGIPMKVSYTQLPVVSGDTILVKLVLLEQGEDGAVLIVPENVAIIFNNIKEDPDTIKRENANFSLIAEVVGLDSSDIELQKTIKSAYLSAGDSLAAFENSSAEHTSREEEQDEEERTPADDGLSVPKDMFKDKPVEELEPEVSNDEAISQNMEAYKKVVRQTDAFKNLLEYLEKTSPKIIYENTEVRYVGKLKNVMLIKVDNKAIYEELSSMPNHAKSLLSNFGESLRKFKHIQLLDSFKLEDSRAFVIAESAGNNYWLTENDNIKYAVGDGPFVKVTDEDLIVLKKSSVRMESRKARPYIKDGDILFKDGGLK